MFLRMGIPLKDIFKSVFRKHIDLRRITALCLGDEERARKLISLALREVADEFEGKKFPETMDNLGLQITTNNGLPKND